MKKQLLSCFLAFICINAISMNHVNAACGIPTGMSVGAITTTSATFDWMPVAGAISYRVQYHQQGTLTSQSGLTGGTSFNATGLTPGIIYEWSVQTICQNGYSGFTDFFKFVTQALPVNAPGGISINSVTTSSATLSWSAVPGTCNYNLQWKPTASVNWTTVTGISSTSFNLSGLAFCTAYQFRVRTFCSTGTSSYSSVMSFTTTGCAVPSSNGPSSNRIKEGENETVFHIALYPNPVRDHLKIEYNSAGNGFVTTTIYNMIGRNIITEKSTVEAGLNILNMNTTDLPAGIYLFEVENNGEVIRSKFMISK